MGWTAKDMLGHMAFWEKAVEPVVLAMFQADQLADDWAFGSLWRAWDSKGTAGPLSATSWARADAHLDGWLARACRSHIPAW